MISGGMNQDFLDVLRAMAERKVEFVVVGAFALACHGIPRATGDIDIFVRPSTGNACRVIAALKDFGAPVELHGISEADLTKPGCVYQIGLPPRRIDILTDISGLSFDEVWRTKVPKDIDGVEVFFIGREAMIVNKGASGRLKDLADIKALKGK